MHDYLLEWKKRLHLEANIDKVTVQCASIKALCEKHRIERVDVLIIDTEGYNFEIIKTIDFNEICPLIIQYESMNLSKETRKASLRLLSKNGYHLIPGRKDTFAIHRNILNHH